MLQHQHTLHHLLLMPCSLSVGVGRGEGCEEREHGARQGVQVRTSRSPLWLAKKYERCHCKIQTWLFHVDFFFRAAAPGDTTYSRKLYVLYQ